MAMSPANMAAFVTSKIQAFRISESMPAMTQAELDFNKALWQEICAGLIQGIKEADISTDVSTTVAVTSVSAVTPGTGVSGPGTGSGSGTGSGTIA